MVGQVALLARNPPPLPSPPQEALTYPQIVVAAAVQPRVPQVGGQKVGAGEAEGVEARVAVRVDDVGHLDNVVGAPAVAVVVGEHVAEAAQQEAPPVGLRLEVALLDVGDDGALGRVDLAGEDVEQVQKLVVHLFQGAVDAPVARGGGTVAGRLGGGGAAVARRCHGAARRRVVVVVVAAAAVSVQEVARRQEVPGPVHDGEVAGGEELTVAGGGGEEEAGQRQGCHAGQPHCLWSFSSAYGCVCVCVCQRIELLTREESRRAACGELPSDRFLSVAQLVNITFDHVLF